MRELIMDEEWIAEWAQLMFKHERMILADFKGGNRLPDDCGFSWDREALNNLEMQRIVIRTTGGFELSKMGLALARNIDRSENSVAKPQIKRMKCGAPCPRCGTEVVKITRETLNHIIGFLSSTFHSVSKGQINGKRNYIPICPQCDAYALGIDLRPGFPFILKNGQESEINQIEHLLWQVDECFRSEDLEPVQPDRDDQSADGAKIIPFPHYTVPDIDWAEIEEIRIERYPALPPEIIDVLKPAMETTPDSPDNFEFQFESYSNDIYPPDPVPLVPGKSCAIWIMDLLDRYGGAVSYNNLSCTVEREEIRHPVFSIQPISAEQFSGIDDCLQIYDFMVRNKFWQVFGKYLTGFDLVLLFVKDRPKESQYFQGLFDTNTFKILLSRLIESKQPWDEILMIEWSYK